MAREVENFRRHPANFAKIQIQGERTWEQGCANITIIIKIIMRYFTVSFDAWVELKDKIIILIIIKKISDSFQIHIDTR